MDAYEENQADGRFHHIIEIDAFTGQPVQDEEFNDALLPEGHNVAAPVSQHQHDSVHVALDDPDTSDEILGDPHNVHLMYRQNKINSNGVNKACSKLQTSAENPSENPGDNLNSGKINYGYFPDLQNNQYIFHMDVYKPQENKTCHFEVDENRLGTVSPLFFTPPTSPQPPKHQSRNRKTSGTTSNSKVFYSAQNAKKASIDSALQVSAFELHTADHVEKIHRCNPYCSVTMHGFLAPYCNRIFHYFDHTVSC